LARAGQGSEPAAPSSAGSFGGLQRGLAAGESVASVAEQLRVSGYRRGDIFPDLANLAQELKMELISGSQG